MVTNSRALAKPLATGRDLAFTTLPFSSDFHVYTHFAEITFPPFCYLVPKCPSFLKSNNLPLHGM